MVLGMKGTINGLLELTVYRFYLKSLSLALMLLSKGKTHIVHKSLVSNINFL